MELLYSIYHSIFSIIKINTINLVKIIIQSSHSFIHPSQYKSEVSLWDNEGPNQTFGAITFSLLDNQDAHQENDELAIM
jgi:hypothetical protein